MNSGRKHRLRITDEDQAWRIVHRIVPDAIVILEVFSKKTAQTPQRVIDACRRRLKQYDVIRSGSPDHKSG